MTKVVLVTVQPRHPSTGVATTIRLAGGGDRKGYYYGGQHYRSGVATPVRFQASIDFDDTGWTGISKPTTGGIAFAPYAIATLTELAAYVWKDAAITVEEGEEETEIFVTRLVGKVADATVQGHKLIITIADFGAALDKQMITARFAGTGGVEGGDEAKGRAKRRTWGRAFNIEGRILDKVNNIYEFGDLAFPWDSFVTLRDMGRAAAPAPTVVTWQGTIAATLNALVASSPAQGSAVVAPSIACVKWWTQPSGPLTADVKGEVGTGYVETVSSIADRILVAAGGPSITNVSTGNSLRAGVAGVHVDETETTASVLDRLLMPASLLWILNPTGTITLREITFSSPAETLISDMAQRVKSLAPMKTRRIGYQRCYRVHGDGEIATSLFYSDGTPIDDLKPTDPGATNNLPGDELQKNASFEAAPDPDGSLPGWVEEGHTVGQNLTRYAISLGRGSYSGLLTGKEAIDGELFPVLAGETLWWTLRKAINAGRLGTQSPGDTATIYAVLRFYTSALSFVSESVIVSAAVQAGSGLVVSDGASTVPAGAYLGRLIYAQDLSYGSSSAQSFIDEFNVSRTEPAADVTRDFDGPPQIGIYCDPLGAPLPGQLPLVVPFRLLKNGVDVSAAAAWGTPVIRSGSASISMLGGNLTIGSVTADTEVRLPVTHMGKSRSVMTQIRRFLADPPVTEGFALDNSLSTVSSTSMAVMSDELSIVFGAFGTNYLLANVGYLTDLTSAATRDMAVIAQKWNGSTWVDIGTEFTDFPVVVALDPTYGVYMTQSPGQTGFSINDTGTPGATAKYRLRGRLVSGSGNLYPIGFFSIRTAS
jgi:hypothetical protein